MVVRMENDITKIYAVLVEYGAAERDQPPTLEAVLDGVRWLGRHRDEASKAAAAWENARSGTAATVRIDGPDDMRTKMSELAAARLFRAEVEALCSPESEAMRRHEVGDRVRQLGETVVRLAPPIVPSAS
jgi:hypothetical protein